METTTQKTAMISTGSATQETVLQILNENKIEYKELGKDQNQNTVIQITYSKAQQPLIDDLQLIIAFVQDAIDLFTPLAIKFIKAFGEEAELALTKLQEKYAGRKLSITENSKNHQPKVETTDGNNERN